jgi:hypothetical protein
VGDALRIAHFRAEAGEQGGALGGAEGGAIMLNLKAQVEQVGHFVRRVCIREISSSRWLIEEGMYIEITIGKLPHLPHPPHTAGGYCPLPRFFGFPQIGRESLA